MRTKEQNQQRNQRLTELEVNRRRAMQRHDRAQTTEHREQIRTELDKWNELIINVIVDE